MSTPEPTGPNSPILLEKMQDITKKVMGHAVFVDPLDKTDENYKTFRKRQKGIALYAVNLKQISEAHAKKVEMDLKRMTDFKATVEAFEKAEKTEKAHPIPEEIKQNYESWKKEEEAALGKIPGEMNQHNADKRKAEKTLKKNNKVYKAILAQEEDRFKTKENKIRDRIRILEHKAEEDKTKEEKDRTKEEKVRIQEEGRELERLQLQKKPYEEYEKDNSVLKTRKSKIGVVNPAIVIADSRMAKLIAKNELHASVQTTVISEIQSANLQPEDKLALEYAVEYSIGQLEGVGDLLLRGLKEKCIASGWVEDPPGNLVYEKPPNSPKFEISTILTSTYNAYVKTGIEKYTLGMSSTTKTKLLEDANITTTLEPVQQKEPETPMAEEHPPILTEFADSKRKLPAVLNPQVMLPEFIASKNKEKKSVTLITEPTTTAVDTPVTPTVTAADPPTSIPSAKLEPEFKHFCDAVVTNYNKRTNQEVDVEEEKNKMKITTPPPWEIRKTTSGNSEITIPHDDGTTAAQHIILSAIQAAAAAHRPVRIDLQDPKQIEFAIEETKKLADVKYVLTPNSKKILNEAREKDTNVRKDPHP